MKQIKNLSSKYIVKPRAGAPLIGYVLVCSIICLGALGCKKETKTPQRTLDPITDQPEAEASPLEESQAEQSPTEQSTSDSLETQSTVTLDPLQKANSNFSFFSPNYDLNTQDNISVAAQDQNFPLRLGKDGNEIAWLGLNFFQARMRLLEQAKKTVSIQTYTFHNDESTRLLANKLIELASKGIKVKFNIDPGMSFIPKNRSILLAMYRNGIEIAGYKPLYANYANIALNYDEFGLGSGKLNMRYHEKIFLVDSQTPEGQGIMGGVNIGNHYFRTDPTDHLTMWRDRDALIRGPILGDIKRAFDENSIELENNANSESVFSTISALGGFILGKPGPMPLDDLNSEIIQSLENRSLKPWNVSWLKADMRFIRSRPRHEESLIMPALLKLITEAQGEILINNSYFLPTQRFIDTLISAANRGVKIKIITNHVENTDFKQLNILSRVEFKQLLALNQKLESKYGPDTVEIYEWAGQPILNNSEGTNHSKYAVFDRNTVMVGSFNIDPRSEDLNSETVIVFGSKEAALPYVQEFYLEKQPNFSQKIDYATSLTFKEPDGLKEKLLFKVSDSLKSLY